MKPIKIISKQKKNLFRSDATKLFKDIEVVAIGLSHALLEGDKEAFHDILIAYLNVINKEELSRRSKIPIATIRRMANGSNFNVDNLLKMTKVIQKEMAA
jgi:predicted transcriptional regulator